MRKQLNDKQERFIHEYLKDQNASAAAVRAGYSASTKGTQARVLMRNPLIRERIEEALGEMFAQLDINAFNLLQQQSRIAFFDPRKLFDKNGDPVPLETLDEASAACLSVNYKEGTRGQWTRQVRQLPRMQALAMLEKRYAQFVEMALAPLDAGEDGEHPDETPEDPAVEHAAPVPDVTAATDLAEPAAVAAPAVPKASFPRLILPAAEPAPRQAGLFQRLFGADARQAVPHGRPHAHGARREGNISA